MKWREDKHVLLMPAVLLIIGFNVAAVAQAPDPRPGTTTPVREQNVDENDWIAVHEQGVAKVEFESTPDVNVVNEIEAEIIGGTIEAQLAGGEIDVNVKTMPPCEAPTRYQYVGTTNLKWTGNRGVIIFTWECRNKFGSDARMCSTLEVMESEYQYGGDIDPAWVRPVIVGNGSTDASGISTASSASYNLSCWGWSTHGRLISGTWVDFTGMTMSSDGSFYLYDCNEERPVACCLPLP